MRRRRSSAGWVLAFLMAVGPVHAQTVYESKGSAGKVYSDRPLPGGKPVELKPLNVVDPVPVAPEAASPAPPPAPDRKDVTVAYRSFSVVFPESGGSVAANTGTFEVRVAIDPPLQISRGHAFVLRLDGRDVPGRFTATEMMVPPEFFGDVRPAGAQQHVIEASVVDLQGGIVTSAAPVGFQTRFVNVLQRPHPLPGQRPLPKPVPRPEEKVERPSVDGLRQIK
jgi:hypothetical protein